MMTAGAVLTTRRTDLPRRRALKMTTTSSEADFRAHMRYRNNTSAYAGPNLTTKSIPRDFRPDSCCRWSIPAPGGTFRTAECWSPIQESPDGIDASFHPRVPAGLQSLVPPGSQLVHHQQLPLKSLSQHDRHTHFCTMACSNRINTSTRLARPAIVRKAEPYPPAISIVEYTTPQAERDSAKACLDSKNTSVSNAGSCQPPPFELRS
jgi:hypothetical protein